MRDCPSIDYVIKGEGEFSMLEFSYNLFNEKIGFGLRMNAGVHLENLPKNLMENFNQQLKKTSIKWPKCINIEKNQLALTEKGFQFADIITSELMI